MNKSINIRRHKIIKFKPPMNQHLKAALMMLNVDKFLYPCQRTWVNSLAPGKFQFHFKWVISKLTLVNGGWGLSYETALRWMPLDLTDDKSTLVQVMAWCRQAPSHYLSQCWPRSMSSNGITRPQWVLNQWHFTSKLNSNQYGFN